MRILSLWQPWATLWAAGRPYGKDIETRSWSTDYRGEVAVHAAKRLDVDVCYEQPFRRALSTLGFDQPIDLPRGAIVGVVDLAEVRRMVGGPAFHIQQVEHYVPPAICICGVQGCDGRMTEQERAFGHYEADRFAWIPRARRMFKEPLPYRGGQGLRVLPEDVVAKLRGLALR